MKILRTLATTIFTAGTLALSFAASAAPTAFNITGATLTPGGGYGQDLSEDGTLLDVRFITTFLAQNFVLSAGNSFTFNVGTIGMYETNNSNGIGADELDALGVTATFTFVTPVGAPQILTATGVAIPGSVSDGALDLTIDWSPILVSFGAAGQFRIDMLDMTFNDNGIGNAVGQTKTQTATITLITEDTPTTPGGTPVPEPSTIALLGLGLLGAAFGRRKSGGGSA